MMTTCVCHVNPRSPYVLMNKNKNIHFRCHCPFLSIEFGARVTVYWRTLTHHLFCSSKSF